MQLVTLLIRVYLASAIAMLLELVVGVVLALRSVANFFYWMNLDSNPKRFQC